MEEKIISLYLSGESSIQISKKLNISKPKVLKILKANNITRSHNHSEKDYQNYWFYENKWWTYWTCEHCNEQIKCFATEKCILYRNLKKKKICKKCSQSLHCGKNNPFYGKKHTKETKEKISKTKMGISTSDHMKQPKYKKLFSELGKKRFESGKYEWLRTKMSNAMKEKIANNNIKGYIRSKAEDEIINLLKKENIECIPNYKIESKIFDIFIPKLNLLIEYNGDYWHCNPKKYSSDYFNVKKQKTAKEIWEYDQKKLDLAIENGYLITIIWESEYKKNNKIILKIVKSYDRKFKNKHSGTSQNTGISNT